jgi:prepilin-type N-terminal cleavage/methylation domain-containing protein
MNDKGFTLIEVMIAVSIFSVGMMAVAALELIALNGYSSSRDQARSSELAQRVISVMKVEALNWGISGANTVNALKPVYADSALGDEAVLKRMAENEWEWQIITETPVDSELDAGVGNHGRYCIYARGGYMRQAIGTTQDAAGDFESSPMIQAQVAVVSPGPTATLTGADACTTLPTMCSSNYDALLNPAGAQIDLETCGMRVVHAATLIRRTGDTI